MVIDGRRYRVTPVDERAEQQRRAWDAQHLTTIATKVPGDVAAALDRYCKGRGLSIYGYLQSLVAQAVQVDLKVGQSHAEWVKLRQRYGGYVTSGRRKGGK